MPARPPSITVVVPTRNVERTVAHCLASLLREIPDEVREVIVVDNGSSDGTLDVVRQFPVRLAMVQTPFVAASRNAGARLATHELLAFIDSDCVVRPGWYAAVAAVLLDARVGVAGCRHELPDEPTWVEAAWHRAHSRPPRNERADVPYVPAGNLAISRALFLATHGFDETLETGEDPDLCRRVLAIGRRVVEEPAMRCVHLGEPKTLGAVFRRERWHGRGVRLRYSDGRLAPVALATVTFAAGTGLTALAAIAAASGGAGWLPLVLLVPLGVAAAYALRYARRPRWLHAFQLLLIYLAYFSGRAAALPVALRRMFAPVPGVPRASSTV